jgi:hypothetical protein
VLPCWALRHGLQIVRILWPAGYLLLFDLHATAGDASGIARKAIDELVRARPVPLLGRDSTDHARQL